MGAEFLTYVLWTITPDGSTTNLGEIPIDKNGQGKLSVTAQSQTFAMIVTAEPYFAVALPSEVVVLENDTKKNTKRKIYPDNNYKLMKRSQYAKLGNPLALTPDLKNVPLDMYEARNAVDIAKAQGAEKYAPDIFAKASSSLQMAENALSSKADKSQIITNARQTIQFAEDARAFRATPGCGTYPEGKGGRRRSGCCQSKGGGRSTSCRGGSAAGGVERREGSTDEG